jgi:hypothetical protein
MRYLNFPLGLQLWYIVPEQKCPVQCRIASRWQPKFACGSEAVFEGVSRASSICIMMLIPKLESSLKLWTKMLEQMCRGYKCIFGSRKIIAWSWYFSHGQLQSNFRGSRINSLGTRHYFQTLLIVLSPLWGGYDTQGWFCGTDSFMNRWIAGKTSEVVYTPEAIFEFQAYRGQFAQLWFQWRECQTFQIDSIHGHFAAQKLLLFPEVKTSSWSPILAQFHWRGLSRGEWAVRWPSTQCECQVNLITQCHNPVGFLPEVWSALQATVHLLISCNLTMVREFGWNLASGQRTGRLMHGDGDTS